MQQFTNAPSTDMVRALDGAGGRPSPIGKQADAYKVGSILEELYQSLHGQGEGGVHAERATAFTADAGGFYPVNTTAAPVTVTPPQDPAPNDTFSVADSRTQFGTNACTVDFTGTTVAGVAGGAVALNTNGQCRRWKWVSPAAGWVLVSAVG